MWSAAKEWYLRLIFPFPDWLWNIFSPPGERNAYYLLKDGRAIVSLEGHWRVCRFWVDAEQVFIWLPCDNWAELEGEAQAYTERQNQPKNRVVRCPPEIARRAVWG